MNKTTSIHIKGFPFIIEEIAYNRLENYLMRLKKALNNQKGTDEIIEDIEMRIAELLNTKISISKQVIEDKDIIDILNTLGDPSDYAESDEPIMDEASSSSNSYEESKENHERRLYRDTESGYIGGVCSGLAGYFNMDPTIIRLIWAAAFFLGGFGLFFYIILWIIIPKANSSIDRLRMKGKPINVDTVKEEVERAAKNVSEKSRNFANEIKNDQRIKDGTNTFRKVIRTIFGFFLLFIGISSLIVVTTLFFGQAQVVTVSSENGFLSIPELAKLTFNDNIDIQLAYLSFYICSASFITFFLLGGFVQLFNLKNKWYRFVNFFLIISGVIGFCVGMVVASRTARDFTSPVEIEKSLETNTIKNLTIVTQQSTFKIQDDYKVKRRNLWNTYFTKDSITEYGISIRYKVSPDSLYHIEVTKKASAHSFNLGENRAKNIDYNYSLKGDSLILPTYYSYPSIDKLRHQKVIVVISIPKGKTVKIEDEIIDLDKKYISDDDEVEYEHKKQRGKIQGDGTYDHWD